MKLREIRQLRNMTQKALAEQLGVGIAIVSKWETGERRPSDRRIKDICRALSVDASTLTTNGSLILTSDGEIVSDVFPEPSLSVENIDADILKEFVELLNSHDISWQKSLLMTAKMKNLLTEDFLEQLNQIAGICGNGTDVREPGTKSIFED